MLWKFCTQYASTFGKLSRGHRTEKRSVFIPILKKGNAKECSNYHTITFILHASMIMLKSFKVGFSSSWTENFQMYKLNLEKAEEPEIKLPTSIGSQKKQGNSLKTCTSASLTMQKPLTVLITANCGTFLNRWEYQATWSASWEICMQVKKQQIEPDMEQRTGSKSGKEYLRVVYCHPTYMQSTSHAMLG